MTMHLLDTVRNEIERVREDLADVKEGMKENVIDADFGPDEQVQVSAAVMYASRRLRALAFFMDELRDGDDEDD